MKKRIALFIIFAMLQIMVACEDPNSNPIVTDTPTPTASALPTNTATPTATPSPSPTISPTPTPVPSMVLGYHWVSKYYDDTIYYDKGYVYEEYPKVTTTRSGYENITNWYRISYKVLDVVTTSHPDYNNGVPMDCYLLEEEATKMICYLDTPSGSGRFGSADTDYQHIFVLTAEEYNKLKELGFIKMDVDPDKLDPYGGYTTFTYRPAANITQFRLSKHYVADIYKFEG